MDLAEEEVWARDCLRCISTLVLVGVDQIARRRNRLSTGDPLESTGEE